MDGQDTIAKDHANVHSAMLVPIILGSDKTTVSVVTGQHDYYPLYLSISNTHNNTQRAHQNAVVLLAFLAIPKSQCLIVLSLLSYWQMHSGPWKRGYSWVSEILVPIIPLNTCIYFVVAA